MVIENKKIEKICNFYVSDFHLEMILLPYIINKIEENEPIQIVSERNLEDTMKELISKVNLKDNMKEQVLKLNWNSKFIRKIENKTNIIIIGTTNFIKDVREQVNNIDKEHIRIIDCYNFYEVKDDIEDILAEHDKSMNTQKIKF